MTPLDYLRDRLINGMREHEMHACLRDTGRLAGGYSAAGCLPRADLVALADLAESLSLNRQEGRQKWAEAVEYGRGEPVRWAQPTVGEDRCLDWDDLITEDDGYSVLDPNWIEPVPVEELKEWEPHKQIIEYLSTLFSAEEHVGYVTEVWRKGDRALPSRGHCDRTAGQLIDLLSKCDGDIGAVFGDYDPEVGAWIRFNPLDGEGVRDANVTDFRFALVESDKMDIERQRGVYEQLELPIAAMVHSGNKSLHAIVRIDAKNKDEYRQRVDLLYKVCAKNGLEVDAQNRNPSRLSRLPGVHRGEQQQYLVATNIGKKSWEQWEEWIEAINDDLPDPEPLSGVWDNLPALAEPLIDGILRQGHKMLVTGPSKAGKSYLLAQLCIAIAEGTDWLGWPCTQGRVLYVNLELDRPSCLHRFRDVYEALQLPPHGIENLDIWNLRGRAVPMDRLAPKLIRRAAKKQYTAVVIDPIYKVITGDENSADKMAHFCNQFDLVCHELKAAVIYCHHHSKGAQGGKRSMDRASGSGVFARDPDALLDLIELPVSDELRKIQENQAVCDLVCNQMCKWIGPDWSDPGEDPDDLYDEAKIRTLASRILGPDRYNRDMLPLIFGARQRAKLKSAWRVECTLREFPSRQPANCWFNHPTHQMDRDGVLEDATPEEQQPPWMRAKTGQKHAATDRKTARKKQLNEAFASLKSFADDGTVTLKELANYISRAPRTAREWAEEFGYRIDGGKVYEGKE
jgi:RecA-family ATPase